MRVAVTGANGFVGRRLCVRLKHDGHTVVRLLRTGPASEFDVVVGDLATTEPDGLVNQSIDAFVHLAARTSVRAGGAEAAFWGDNVEGTRRALLMAQRARARRFVFISSAKVNGETTDAGSHFTATDIPRPQDLYARSKLEAELLVKSLCAQNGMSSVILRPPIVYGLGARGNLRQLYKLAGSGMPMPFDRIGNERSMVHVDNLVDLIVLSIERPAAADSLFMAADGTLVSTDKLFRIMAAAQGRRARLFHVDSNLLRLAGRFAGFGDRVDRLIGNLKVDDDDVRVRLNWTPPVPWRDALVHAFSTE